MDMIKTLEFRNVELTDNLQEIGALIYHTDPFIYPAFLGNEECARIILEEAIKREMYCFKKENIFCAFLNESPIAILCNNPEGKLKWNYDEWKALFVELKVEMPDAFDIVAKEYFEPMNEEVFDDTVYILAVSVAESMRNQGIGKQLMHQFLMHHSREKVVLDTLKDNKIGVALYKGTGFLEQEEYIGFSVNKPFPECIRMQKIRQQNINCENR